MKYLAVLIFILLSETTLASAFALFGDETKAVIVIQGNTDDYDAYNLFKSMNVEIEKIGGKLIKRMHFTSRAGEKLMSLGCQMGERNQYFGSCSMEIFRSSRSHINKSKREIVFSVQNLFDVRDLAALFSPSDRESGLIFLSSDDHLGIFLDYSGSSLSGFRIFYNE